MRTSRFDHMAIHVTDREDATTVARELLGLEHVEDIAIPSPEGLGHLRVMKSPQDNVYLVLCDAEGDAHPIARAIEERGPGVHHLAHGVKDVDAALSAAILGGASSVGEIASVDGLRQVFVRLAGDGLLHELIERKGREVFVPRNTADLINAGALEGGAEKVDSDAPRSRR